jgi:type IV pilus assembly protein PilW
MSAHTRQRGLTLLEVMIGLLIGLVVVLLVIQVFQAQNVNHRMQQALARLQENARFSVDFLTRDIRMAGRANTALGLPITVAPFLTDTIGTNDAIRTKDGSEPSGNASRASDQITIQYYQPTGNINQDCLGGTVAANTPVQNRYYIQVEADGYYSLYCDGNGNPNGGGQPLARGVDSMQIQYGVDLSGDQLADIYVNAFSLNSNTYSWNNVVSVRINLVVNSQQNVHDVPHPGNPISGVTYPRLQLLDALPFNRADATHFPPASMLQHLRRTFTTTIMLRNRAP